jgi:hypothetical protein
MMPKDHISEPVVPALFLSRISGAKYYATISFTLKHYLFNFSPVFPGPNNAEGSKIEIKNRKPKTENRKPKTKNQKPKTKNQKPKTKNQKPKTKNQKPKTKNQKPKIQKLKIETRIYINRN